MSEAWAARELFCLQCPSGALEPLRTGTKVVDFSCPECAARYQVKSKQGNFGRVVTNSAYQAKIDAIEAGTVPNYVFVGYSSNLWRVTSGFVVPGHFITTSVIQKRKPLGPTARRHGWVGSNILLGDIPQDGRVALIENGFPRTPVNVRRDWSRFVFMREKGAEARGWLGDILRVVRELEKPSFHLSEVYALESELRKLHPNNRHIVEKIRQQVQLLRDKGILESLGRGRYELRD